MNLLIKKNNKILKVLILQQYKKELNNYDQISYHIYFEN